jgi:hypothetical protein
VDHAPLEPSLLDGPVGLVALLAIARARRALGHGGLAPDAPDAGIDWSSDSGARQGIAELIAGAFDAAEDAEALDDAPLMAALAGVVTGFAHGHLAQDRPMIARLRESADLLRPFAERLAQNPTTRWWWGPVGTDQLVAHDCSGVSVTDERTVAAWPARWWSAPTGSTVVHSSRSGPGGTPVGLLLAEDHWVLTDAGGWSGLEPRGESVYEVADADAWQALVNRYPVERTRGQSIEWDSFAGGPRTWVDVDWHGVEQDHDGVHVSVAAHLSAAYRPLPVAGGHTMLAGWNPDVTVWFHEDVAALRLPT